jgi:dipeptidyl aminopeptidase/acylaminoacyl peptidase
MDSRQIMLGGSARTVFFLALIFSARIAAAHPGVGIVQDNRGNIYYTDLKQVWRITPDGQKSVVVRNVHTHELVLDAQDNLYGEHLWYEGERTDRWGHYVWRRSPDGRVEKIFGPRQGFLYDYRDFSFLRDAADNLYFFVAEGGKTRIVRRSPDGIFTDIASTTFNNMRWKAAAPDGTLYVVDFRGGWKSHLIRITPDGNVRTMATELSAFRFSIFGINDQHAVMGLAPDAQGNVYLAVTGNRVVKKVAPSGQVTVVSRGSGPWSPTGVLPARDGSLWILENSGVNVVRVRHLRPNGSAKTY